MSTTKKKKKTTFHLPSLSSSFKTSGQISFDKILNQTSKPTTLKNTTTSLNDYFNYEEYNQLPIINTEVELIHNLSFDENPEENILNSSIRYIKEKEKIDNDIEIKEKRLGKTNEEKKALTKDEIKANQSREFFLKYEMMKNEKIMDEEITKLKKSLEEVRGQKEKLNLKIILLLKEIYDDQIDIRFLNSDDFFLQIQKNNLNNIKIDDGKSTISVRTHGKNSKKHKKREEELDSFYLKTLQLKEQTLRNSKKQEKENELNEKLNELKFLKTQYDTLKDEYKLRKKKLEDKIKFASDYYHKKLYEGLDIRNEGLIWIIKAIWNLGENITMSFFPNFLDQYSIDYLFNAAHKSYEISIIKEQVNKLRKELDSEFEVINKHNPNKNLFRTSIHHRNFSRLLSRNRIEKYEKIKKEFGENYTLKNMTKFFKENKNPYSKILDNPSIQIISDLATQSSLIEYEILKLKRIELDRLFKEFFENKYGERYHVNLETVVGALVGENKRDNEMVKYYKMKREYFDNMRYIQYFNLSNERSLQIKENKDNMKNNNIGNSN